MPTYMDIHEFRGGVTPEEIAKAHEAHLAVQQNYGGNYLQYWVNDSCGKVFCLVEAPNAEAAHNVPREAHGFVAEKIIEIQPEVVEGFLGGGETNASGAAVMPGRAADDRDPAIRTILFTDIVDSTTLTQTLGDEAAMALLDMHDTVVRDALAHLGGREVKHTGDGIMASFVSAAAAVKCATQIQRDLVKHGENQRDRAVKVRIGAAAGEPVEQHTHLFGGPVQLSPPLSPPPPPSPISAPNPTHR